MIFNLKIVVLIYLTIQRWHRKKKPLLYIYAKFRVFYDRELFLSLSPEIMMSRRSKTSTSWPIMASLQLKLFL